MKDQRKMNGSRSLRGRKKAKKGQENGTEFLKENVRKNGGLRNNNNRGNR